MYEVRCLVSQPHQVAGPEGVVPNQRRVLLPYVATADVAYRRAATRLRGCFSFIYGCFSLPPSPGYVSIGASAFGSYPPILTGFGSYVTDFVAVADYVAEVDRVTFHYVI